MAIPDLNLNASNSTTSKSINDLLYISNSDHPGMVLTNTPFNGSNFLGWSHTVKMALGAKFKLGFINETCVKPAEDGGICKNRPVQHIEKHKQVTNHVAEPMAFYANMNQNKIVKKDVKAGRNDETPFDMRFENELQRDQSFPGVDQKLVATMCQEVMKMFQGKNGGQDMSGASTSMYHAGTTFVKASAALCSVPTFRTSIVFASKTSLKK
nr:sulfotransferase 16 [Tanacetum cinerariifolium]